MEQNSEDFSGQFCDDFHHPRHHVRESLSLLPTHFIMVGKIIPLYGSFNMEQVRMTVLGKHYASDVFGTVAFKLLAGANHTANRSLSFGASSLAEKIVEIFDNKGAH